MSRDLEATSKFLSLVLRHRSDTIGLSLTSDGWANVSELVAAARERGLELSEALVLEVVRSSDKQRFALSADGACIRANQGHSVAVDLNLAALPPPCDLFHGTGDRFLDSIRAQGLLAGSRQHVHLSAERATAERVGAHRSENGVWLTDRVPIAFLDLRAWSVVGPDRVAGGRSALHSRSVYATVSASSNSAQAAPLDSRPPCTQSRTLSEGIRIMPNPAFLGRRNRPRQVDGRYQQQQHTARSSKQ